MEIHNVYSTSLEICMRMRERSYCAPSCTTQLVSLALFSICCQPSSIIRNFGGVPPSDKLVPEHKSVTKHLLLLFLEFKLPSTEAI